MQATPSPGMQETLGFDLTHISFQGVSRHRTGYDCHRAPSPASHPSLPLVRRRFPLEGRERDEDRRGGEFARRILARAGIDAGQYRAATLKRRTPACLRALKVTTEGTAIALLERQPERLPVALSALLVGVTRFFRDSAVFDMLRAQVLPALASRNRPVRVWCAACSRGSELYSIAVLLAEAGLIDRAELLGTDCRADAIAEAQRSEYSAATTEELPAWALSYWQRTAAGWHPSDRLRAAARWKVSDLSRETEKGPWDLLLCRNLCIYLEPGPASQLACRLAETLAPGGFLVLGQAERPPAEAGLDRLAACVYQRGSRR